ncbi:probable methyltransferase-like protein 25 [Diabrotica virgifera virgifera]|uniref:Methyltransferase domain-containing protein n=1 Tax=Diabrotica virgifera virgifera TaxID=50390 RepID=A0ABM5IHN5_DIAVI|nr:probable methyltransferase-like protein 25 [Diabrotica virgifera virgifera]
MRRPGYRRRLRGLQTLQSLKTMILTKIRITEMRTLGSITGYSLREKRNGFVSEQGCVRDMNSPPTVQELIDNISKLKPNLESQHLKHEDDIFSHNCCLSNKKRHEIVILSPVIDQISKGVEADLVLDIGSGLGYLSHHLHSKYKHKVLGIECSKQYVVQAYKMQQKIYPHCKNGVQFVDHYIDAQSAGKISSLIQETFTDFDPKSVSLVGLHACADLSVTVLDLFSQLDRVKSLVIMPCCYHRLKLKEEQDDKEYFYNFPFSNVFKDIFDKASGEYFLRRSFLRLACQQASRNFCNMSQEEHVEHSTNLMFRCILQLVAESENLDIKRLKRKSTTHSSTTDIEDYLSHLPSTHQLKPRNPNDNHLSITDEVFLNKMRDKWNEYKDKCFLLEVLTGLQAALQNVCENIVLLDRVEYLKEKGFEARVQKITDDLVSPRCYALIARKE